MSQGTLYGIGHSRAVLPIGLIKFYGLDVATPEKDDFYFNTFPLQKSPTFVGAKGYKLTEVMAVCLHLISLSGDKSLLGKSDNEFHQILMWMSTTNTELLPKIAGFFKPTLGKVPYNKKSVMESLAAAIKVSDIYEVRLKEYTYLVGERLSLADLFSASLFMRGFMYAFGSEWRESHPATVRWFKTIIQHPVLEELRSLQFIDKPIEYTPPKKEKKEQAPNAPNAEKPVAAAAAEASAPAWDAPEFELPAATAWDAPREQQKPKHPFKLLGKSTKFNLDEWKRTYSNEETREVALPWFWEHYDPEEWSLWRADYKYNDELTLTFMSNNLLGGFFNRLIGSTKYMFGSGVVYGENNNNGIVCVFLVRGQEHEPAFDVAPDWESYEFKKLDASDAKTKEFVDDIFAWDKPLLINGETREVADGKVFK